MTQPSPVCEVYPTVPTGCREHPALRDCPDQWCAACRVPSPVPAGTERPDDATIRAALWDLTDLVADAYHSDPATVSPNVAAMLAWAAAVVSSSPASPACRCGHDEAVHEGYGCRARPGCSCTGYDPFTPSPATPEGGRYYASPDDHDYPRHFPAPSTLPAETAAKEYAVKCPRCESPSPTRHPAVQFEGEVHVCPDPFHASTEDGRKMLARATLPAETAEEKALTDALQQRDDAEEWADRLAAAIASATRVPIGEHSSGNNPWANALHECNRLTRDGGWVS